MALCLNIFPLEISNCFLLRSTGCVTGQRTFRSFFGFATKEHLTYRTRDGLQYYVRTNTTDRSIVNSVAIQDEYQLRQLNLREAVIIDLGGRNGYFSVFAARYARRILTYEPIPENFDNILKTSSSTTYRMLFSLTIWQFLTRRVR